MSCADLRNAELKRTVFCETDLSGADISNAIFVDCDLSTVDFDNAIVRNTEFIECISPQIGPTRLRLSKSGAQVLTGYLAKNFFTQPVIEAEVQLHHDRVVRKITQVWVAKNCGEEIVPGIVLVGAETEDGVVRIQLKGKNYRQLRNFRATICAYFEPLEREDWVVA